MTEHTQSDIELVHSALRPLLMMLGDYRNLSPALLRRLNHMVSLFPTSFNEKMCDSLLVCECGVCVCMCVCVCVCGVCECVHMFSITRGAWMLGECSMLC